MCRNGGRKKKSILMKTNDNNIFDKRFTVVIHIRPSPMYWPLLVCQKHLLYFIPPAGVMFLHFTLLTYIVNRVTNETTTIITTHYRFNRNCRYYLFNSKSLLSFFVFLSNARVNWSWDILKECVGIGMRV